MNDLFVFIHIFKCGGSSMCHTLNSNMDKINIKCDERIFVKSPYKSGEGWIKDIMLWKQKNLLGRNNKLVNETFKSLENIKFIGGHMNLKVIENTFENKNLKTFCLFRNPILRTISGIIYIGQKTNINITVENVINKFKQKIKEYENKGGDHVYRGPFGGGNINSIKKKIDGLSCILILEDLDNLLIKLNKLLNKNNDKNNIKLDNVVKNKSNTKILSTSKIYDIIKKDENLMKQYNKAFKNEIIIYNYAVNKYNEKYNCNIEKYK